MIRFSATYVPFPNQQRALVALYDACGRWAGAYRVDIRIASESALYEAAYARAEQMATVKGGMLDRFRREPLGA